MLNKKFMLISIFLLAMLAISAVSANEINCTDDSISEELNVCDDLINEETSDSISLDSKDNVLGAKDDGTYTALKNKINNAPNGSTIIFENDYNIYDETLYQEEHIDGIFISDKNLTIDGNGHKIDGANKSSIFDIHSCNLVLKNIEFCNGCSEFSGAIDVWGSNLTIINSSFNNNGNPQHSGGAIDVGYYCNLTIINSSFNNNAAYDGGAINFDGKDCNTNITGCTFSNNTAKHGGAIYIDSYSGSFNIKNSSFIKNSADFNGGAINVDHNCTVNITNSLFKDNEGVGSGIYIGFGGNVTVRDGTFLDLVFVDNGNIKFIESTNISSTDVIKYYGGPENYIVKITKDNVSLSNVDVKITVYGKTHTVKTDSKGQASIPLDLPIGVYDVISEYDDVATVSKVTVKSTVTSSDSTGTYLNSKVSATFLDTNGKALANTKVSFKVGSKTYTATTNSNGVATANVDLDVGTYNVTATNPKTNEQKTSKLTISKAKSTMTLSSTSNNGEVTLTASLSPNASGNVVFNLNNKNYTVKINNSKASQTITGLNTGNYTAKASYAGDKNLNSSSASAKVTVKKVIATKIIYEDMQTGLVPKSEGRIGNYFCVKLVDDKGNAISGVPIKIGFNGVIYNRTTLSDGSARLQINLAKEDLYTFAICFLGDDDYQASFEVAKIDVSKKYPKPNMANKTTNATNASATQHESRLKTYISYGNMDTKSVLKVEGRAGEYFVVKLLDNNKKALADVPIKIGFNGVIYNRTTNATGEARLQINLLKPTLYTFAIAYLGDSKYQAAFEVAKITVKAQTPKLTSASKTFKASAKTKSLSATLVSARGAAISGQKLSFTVNGKTYTGKTNSKGVATVNISLNKKGTYSCSVKFAGMTGASAKTTKLAVKIT